MLSLKTKIVLLSVICLAAPLFGASLTGVVTDKQTGEPVPGAYVKVAGRDIGTVTDSGGKFKLQGVPDAGGRLVISHIAYNIAKMAIDPEVQADVRIVLAPKVLRGQDVIVTATRATQGETPAAFSNLTGQDIEKAYWAQDTPMFLTSLPNIFAYSDAGNGVGYSYMKIRGFNQQRISVMLNGIPLNDAQSHEVFWIDLPDFASNVQDIQVQRGVGTSIYGPSALGGSVNLITNDFSAIPEIKFESGYGSYNTKKLSISGNSGLVKDAYVFYGRYSRIETDGYRENSWSNMYSYFIGVARYDANMTWKFNTYGGPEETHLAYKGITAEQLRTDRRYNELEYPNEIDHFNQPHYELLHDWQLSDRLELSNTLYYFNGDGYYNQLRDRRDYEEYFPGTFSIDVADTTLAPRDYYDLDDNGDFVFNADSLYSITKVDLIRRPAVIERDWGWIPRLDIKHARGTLSIGGDIRIHSGHHFGEIVWASLYPAGENPDTRYYDYRGRRSTMTAYAYETYRLFDKFTLMANLQYQRHNYKLDDDRRFDVSFDRSYDFLSPRAGVTYRPADKISVFFNASTASRQPTFKDIYDPTDYWSNPDYKPDNFDPLGAGWDFVGRELKPERLMDLEFGANFQAAADQIAFEGGLNLYRMQMNDELVPYAGQIDDMGYPISGNADKTLHQGIELSLNMTAYRRLLFTGNLSLNDDHFVNYTEYGFDYDAWQHLEFDRDGKHIGGYPEMLANYRLGYQYDWPRVGAIEIGVSGRYVGEQFIDNGETFKLDPYHIADAHLSFDFGVPLGVKSLKVVLRVNNLLDIDYEQAAYIEPDDALPRYMVGAERNFFVSLGTSF